VILCSIQSQEGGAFYPKNGNAKKKKYDLIVIRVIDNDELGNSRPCFNCLRLMKLVGIRKVYYSVSPDKIVGEKVSKMISIQASASTQMIYRELYNAPKCKEEFFRKLLIELFPDKVNEENFRYFIEYNLKIVLPNYKTIITGKKSNRYIEILDNNNCVICKSKLEF
jgi:hypothetical protein